MKKELRTKRSNFFLATLIVTCCALIASVLSACKPDENEPAAQSGDEVGVYYFDDDQNREFLLTLSEGLKFTFVDDEDVKIGSYSLKDGTLTLTDDEWSQTATVKDEVITMGYNNVSMRFLRKIYYSVEFDTDGGSTVATEKVLNGKTVAKPESDPSKPGYVFLGWYADEAYTSPYIFGAQPVNADVKIYARWAQQSEDGVEYTISYDLGYEGAEIADAVTIGGKLYNSAVPVREGYTFGGWWISMENQSDRLTYSFEEPSADGNDGTVFTADTTLFAVWNADDSDYETDVPAVDVTAKAISWEPNGAARYKVNVTAPDGTSVYAQETASTTVAISFDQTGAYKVEVTSLNAGGTQISETAVRYFVNNGLDRVTGLKVIEPGILVYNAVPGAEKYLITIDCGNDAHNHKAFDNGTSLYYNFSNCDMQEGGIIFTVEAVAKNYASSKATIAYERNLDKVENLAVNNDIVTWDAADGANYYVVKVGDKTYNVFGTEYSLKQLSAGKYDISVTPVAKGFNSPDAATLSVEKATPALPADIRLTDTTLSWTAAEDGAEYEIIINGQTLKVEADQLSYDLDLIEALTWTNGAEYKLQLKVIKGQSSVLSDEFSFLYNELEPTLVYEGGKLSWKAVGGATEYDVQINGETYATITDGSNYCNISSLATKGINTLSVRFRTSNYTSEWVSTEVYAHSVTFNSGDGESETIYKAVGDEIIPPEAAAVTGYDFAAWYNTPNGPESNGALFDAPFFANSGELVLYAYYTPKAYTVQFNEAEGLTTGKVYYGEHFTFEVPAAPNETTAFGGWYSAPYGAGVAYTDAHGNSLAPWNIAQDGVQIYAFWVDAVLTYNAIGSNYAVSQGARINLVESVTIPAQYNNISITSLTANAFAGCTTLKEINIPDTIQNIPSSAFEGCTALEAINIYSTGAALPRYSSQDGVLFDGGDATAPHALRPAVVPAAKTGTFTIPAGVDIIPSSAFAGSMIEKVVIPSSVKTIEREAFANCASLVSVVFENLGASGTLTIGDRAFLNCEQLESITLPARLTEISLQRYDELRVDTFESIDELTEQSADAFLGCDNLASINVAASASATYTSEDGVLIKNNTLIYFPSGKIADGYTFPAVVRSIGDGAFLRHPNSNGGISGELKIPARITSVGAFAFMGCNITSLIFEGGEDALSKVTIGEFAFYGSDIETLTFGEKSKVSEIGANAFANCADLETVTIPATMESIGDNAFSESGLTSIVLTGDASKKITLTLGSALFYGCELDELNLPANASIAADFLSGATVGNVTVADGNDFIASEGNGLYLKASDGSLETFLLYIPSTENPETEFMFAYYDDEGNVEKDEEGNVKVINVRNIAASAFAGNDTLEKVVIPSSVITIGDEAFSGSMIYTVEFTAGGSEKLDIGYKAFYGIYDDWDEVGLGAIKLPDRPITIGEYAFANNGAVQEISLGGTTYIGDYAFSNTGYTGYSGTRVSLVIPKTVETIGNYAFEGSYDGRIYGATFEELEDGETYALKTIGAFAFSGSYITSFNVPATVESLGTRAFYDCENLESLTFEEGTAPLEYGTPYDNYSGLVFEVSYSLGTVHLPGRLTVLHNDAFYSGYTSYSAFTVTFGDQYAEGNFTESRLTTIGENAFRGSKVTTLTIPSSVTSIGANAFYGTSLETITFEDGGTDPLTIGDYAFNECSSLESVVFPSNLSELGINVFQDGGYHAASSLASIEVAEGCKAFASKDGALYSGGFAELLFCPPAKTGKITIADETLRIADQAFAAAKVEEVAFGENSKLTEIGDQAFLACSNLTSVVLPNSVTTIGNDIFLRCNNLESVTLPASLATFTASMLGCDSLQNIYIGDGSTTYKSVDGVLFSADLKTLVYYLPTRADESYEIPAGTEQIAAGAFSGNAYLKNVTIPASVKLLNANAFSNCTKLTGVNFADGSTEPLVIGKYAFSGCTSLASIALPSRTSAIEDYAFNGATSLSNVTFAKANEVSKLTSIGTSAFFKTALTRVTIPESVRTLGDTVYGNCYSLVTATLPEGLISAGNSIFSGCSALDTVNLPASLQTIGTGMFANCSALKHINFAAGAQLSTIPSDTFSGCTALEAIQLPASLTAIAGQEEDSSSSRGLFQGLTNLKTVTFEEGSKCLEIGISAFEGSGITTFTIPSSVTTIRNKAFYGTALTDIVIPKTVARLDGYVFGNCKQLKSVTIDAELSEILDSTFENCSALESINIPATIKYIAATAFSGCGNFNTISLDSNNKSFILDENGALFNAEKTELYILPATIEEFTVPATLTSDAFISVLKASSSLKEITVESGNTAYNAKFGALYDADWNLVLAPNGMTEFTIPAEVSKVSSDMLTLLAECGNLVSVKVEDGVTGYKAAFGVLYDDNWTPLFIPSGLTEYVIPKELTEIQSNIYADSNIEKITFEDGRTAGLTIANGKLAQGCFSNMASLVSVELPADTSIGSYAFANCSNLEEVILTAGTSGTIGDYAFRNDSKLTSLIIPEGYTKIGGNAFAGTGITSINLPASLSDITSASFAGSSISEITVAEGSTYLVVENGILYNADKSQIYFIPSGITTFEFSAEMTDDSIISMLESVPTLESVTVAAENTAFKAEFGALYDAEWNLLFVPKAMTTFTIPVEVTQLGGSYETSGLFDGTAVTTVVAEEGEGEAFIISGYSRESVFDGANVTSVTLPDRTTEIGNYAFYDMDCITEFSYGNAVLTSIGDYAFSSCYGIESFTINLSVTYVGDSAFQYWGDNGEQTIYLPFAEGVEPDSELGWDRYWDFNVYATLVYADSSDAGETA